MAKRKKRVAKKPTHKSALSAAEWRELEQWLGTKEGKRYKAGMPKIVGAFGRSFKGKKKRRNPMEKVIHKGKPYTFRELITKYGVRKASPIFAKLITKKYPVMRRYMGRLRASNPKPLYWRKIYPKAAVKSFKGKIVPTYYVGSWTDQRGDKWKVYGSLINDMSAWVRLERKGRGAKFIYDAGGGFRRSISGKK